MAPAKVDIVKANQAYSDTSNFGERGSLSIPPAKKLAVVTCMDARLDPADFLGLQDGDAHVIRNAGGLAKEAVRSLVISQRLLGTEDILVIHHSDCGMLTFTNEFLRNQLTEAHPGNPAVANAARGIEFGPFGDLDESVKGDVAYLKNHPLIQQKGTITGWVYEVENGKIRQVA
ncbi:carbonic anhydrase [Paxillus ammoniavirescens]|nr:carbonic anhydrase [Paxillus ammoniavirescens]